MKRISKNIIKRIMTFVLTVSMVLGLVPIDGLMKVAYASETTYSITIADGIINGTVTADKTTAAKGETVTLTISPDNLYELYDLSVKCGESTVPFYWATTSFVMPDGDVTVNVSFKKKTTYTTFFKYSGKTFSKTTPNGESSTFELTDVLDALLGTTTDEINNVEVNGSCISASQQNNKWMLTTYYGGDSFESTAVLKVTVGGSEYSIDISASQDSIPVIIQGSVRFDANGGSGTMDTMSGRTDKFFVLPECSFTPPDGMEFDTWKIGSDYYPEGTTYRWKESVVAYAQWKDIEGVHSTIVSNSEPSKGSLVVSPTKALQNTNIVLTPQPANGYAVDSISYSYEGSGALQPTANQDGTYSFSMPDKDVTVTITFKEDTAVSIPYLDANGNNANCTSNTYVSESDTTWNTGWYVVNRTLTINNRIVVDGNVNLILADGATLNAQSGITVYGNNSLNIFAQSTGENKGKLCADATQKPNYAAIGGANSEETMNCGSVNIYGGDIEAHGGQNSAGIGGGDVSAYKGGSGGTITINAGTIKSYGGNWYGAGIGGGRHGNGGIIRINGGYVEAYGNYGAAGIGGGLDGESGNITITGGTILAKGSICEGYKPEWGAGIGSGRDAEANRIEITGGNVTAYGASDSAAIGSGRNRKCNEIIISGGVINAIAYSTKDVGIGSSRSSTSTGTISLSWTNVSVDEINSSSYKGTVTLEKAFVDKLDSTVSFEAGDLADNSAIGGKTIVPHDSSAHYHRFTYVVSQDGKTITATCGNSGCSLTNNAATLTIAAPTGSLVYDGSAKAATVTGDTSVLGTPSIAYKKGNTSLGLNAPKDVGTYTASITLGSGEGAATVSVGFTITARPITITAADQSVELNGEIATGTDMWSVNGELADGQSISKVTLTASSTASAGSGTITPSAVIKDASGVIVTANYNITYTAGTLTVTDASAHTHSLTYSASGATITATCSAADCTLTDNKTTLTINAPIKTIYGDANSASATLTGLDAFNSATSLNITETGIKYVGRGNTTYVESDTAPVNAGTYTASITAGSKTASVDYTIASKPISITGATATDRDYVKDSTSVEISAVTFDGATLTKGTDYTVTGAMEDDTAGDSKSVTVTVTLMNGNYTFGTNGNTTTTTVKIDKINHDGVSASGSAKYGAEGSVDLSSLIEAGGSLGEVSVTDTNGVLDGTPTIETDGKTLKFKFSNNSDNVGKTATVTIPVEGETNYKDYNIVVTLTVTDKVVPTLSVSDFTKTYDDNSVTISDLTKTAKDGSLDVDGIWDFEGTPGLKNVSDSGSITVRFTPTDTVNYESATATFMLTINRKAVTVKADNKSMVVGTTPEPELTATVSGTVGNDTVNYTVSREAGTAVGTYTITPSGDAEQGNYAVSYETGTFTITEDATTPVVKKAPKAITGLVYNGKAQALITAGEATGGTFYYALGNENAATEPYTTSIPTATNAGTYYVWYKVDGGDNHNDINAEKIDVKIDKSDTIPNSPSETMVVDKPSDKTADVILDKQQGTTAPVVKKEGTILSVDEIKAEVVVTSKTGKDPTVTYTKTTDNEAKSVVVSDNVTVDGVTYEVSSVGANSFNGSDATTVTLGKNIKKMAPKALNGSKIKTVVLRTTKLTKKSVKNAFKGSKAKKIVIKVKVGSKKLNKKYVKKYKKIFTKKNVGVKVVVK